MDRGHKDLNEIVALIAKLPKTQKFREDPDFKALCLYFLNCQIKLEKNYLLIRNILYEYF